MQKSIFIGWEPREASAFAVARHSIRRRMTQPIPIRALVLSELRAAGLYVRPTSVRDGRLWDDISEAPCSTEFSNSRFLVPHLAKTGWALFLDCDFMARVNIARVFDLCDPSKAVMCVKHNHVPAETVKMDGQIQTKYGRKNWSSMTIFNCNHPANKALTLDVINTWPGRDLHAFKWLDDSQIGELPPEWNHLVGEHEPNPRACLVHHTLGTPAMPGYEDCEFAADWRAELEMWAAGRLA